MKLTPPFPGVPQHLIGNRIALLRMFNIPNLPVLDSQIRYDNLFLHLGHAYVEVEGGMNTTGTPGATGFLFGAEGNLVALQDTQIASCRGELAISDWSIKKLVLTVSGDIRPKGLSLGGVNGDMIYIPQNNVQLRGAVDLAGYDVKGSLALSDRPDSRNGCCADCRS